MLPRGSSFVVATAAVLLGVQACIWLGRTASEAAVVLCAFALMIGGPIAVLAWVGSMSDADAKRRQQSRRREDADRDALLWQRMLAELQVAPATADGAAGGEAVARYPALTRVASACAGLKREAKRIARPILALWLAAAVAVGLAGCGVPPEAWAAVRPGMGTSELVSLVGGPDYIRSNGTAEVWQYCRDFPGRDEGRYARYYTAILVDRQQVKEIQPYAVLSDAGCQDFYRAEF